MKKNILVTGAGGYLGRITARILLKEGYQVVGIDNFSTSKKVADPSFNIFEVEMTSIDLMRSFFKTQKIDAVIHFAARALVPESVENPTLYFNNNLLATINLCQMAVEFGVKDIVHSSSCAVYGIPKVIPIKEDSPYAAVSPYGETKVIAEKIFQQYCQFKSLKAINLRYFNPGGAFFDQGEWLGEAHEPETHLIPNLLNAIKNKKSLSVFGNDYPTKDGSCIRDFIHVEDLAKAHIKALQFLEKEKPKFCTTLNVGSGKGFSVFEIIEASKKFAKEVSWEVKPRRSGDPAELIADTTLASKVLQWKPEKSITDILTSHWEWMNRL